MFNNVTKSFFTSPLEQFDSVFALKIKHLWALSQEFSQVELQNFDIVEFGQDLYDEYLGAFDPSIVGISAIIFYFVMIFIAKALGIPIKTFSYKFPLLGDYVVYFFLKAIYYLSACLSFFLILSPLSMTEMAEITYQVWLIKTYNIVVLDLFLYAAFIFAWFYYFQRKAEYYDFIGVPFIVPKNNYHYFLEFFHRSTIDFFSSVVNKDKKTQKFYPIVYVLFFFLLVTNVQGLIPYSYTATSHLINTFYLALGLFSYIIYLIFTEKGLTHFLTLFLPSGTPLPLTFLLVPIEIVSYFFRVVSLSVRLFANMMAGHTLLKVILGFSWSILAAGEFYYIINFVPIIILMLLTMLELGVALIQSYIFSILTCIYLKDAFEGH